MTVIKDRCVERACARLSARKINYLSAVAMARSDQSPLQALYADLGTSPRSGCVRGMGVGLGVEVGVAVVAVGVEEKR